MIIQSLKIRFVFSSFSFSSISFYFLLLFQLFCFVLFLFKYACIVGNGIRVSRSSRTSVSPVVQDYGLQFLHKFNTVIRNVFPKSSLYNWLRADPLNVAVVHCIVCTFFHLLQLLTPNLCIQGGKGRTGTVIGCYFLLTGLFDDPNNGLEYFANKRSSIANGVTQPCQKRYGKNSNAGFLMINAVVWDILLKYYNKI